MNFSSTLLAQTNDPKEIQKADLDLLAKVNQVAAALPSTSTGTVTTYASWASVVAYAAPLPQSAAGVGQWIFIYAGGGVALSLPAGGTWAYYLQPWYVNYPGGNSEYPQCVAGVAAGGTQIYAATSNWTPMALCWRIA